MNLAILIRISIRRWLLAIGRSRCLFDARHCDPELTAQEGLGFQEALTFEGELVTASMLMDHIHQQLAHGA